MGRKIPGRKHRGVRDPEQQRLDRFNRVKNKINAPPTNVDDQYVPKSLLKIMELKDKVKTGALPVKKKQKSKRDRPVTSHPFPIKERPNTKGRPVKATPVYTQQQGESDKAFLHRVHRITQDFIKETQFEDKYGVDVRRDEETGDVIDVVKRPKDELELLVKKARKEEKKPKKKKKAKKSDEPKLTKSQKRRAKLLEKKEKKSLYNMSDELNRKDEVRFGEVVHAPPTLTAPRKVKPLEGAPRPGQKDLLLKSVLMPKTNNNRDVNVESGKSKLASTRKVIKKTIDRKGKRKELPAALRRQLDRQQQEVINAYKLLKKQKINV